jgi:hypothetical protein
LSETTIEQEPTPDEADIADTVECEGFCEREVFEEATVDVVAGATLGEWTDPKPHVGVTGVDGGDPAVQQWCLSCAEDWFGVHKSATEQRMETVRRYVTPATVAAFLLGVTLVVLAVLLV